MAAAIAFPKVDRFVAGSVANEGNLGAGMQPITPMTTTNVDRMMYQVSTLQTMMAQNMKMDKQTAEPTKVSARTAHVTTPSYR